MNPNKQCYLHIKAIKSVDKLIFCPIKNKKIQKSKLKISLYFFFRGLYS